MHNSTCNSGGGNVGSSTRTSEMKKQQKRPKVPKRGPGVAELEKILREQQNLDISDKGNSEQIDAIQHESANYGLGTHLEHPSNQSSCYNYTYRVPDEQHNMIGMNGSHSSTLENSLISPSNFRVLPSFSHYNIPQQSSVNDSHGVSNFNSTEECCRDENWGRTLELGNTRYNSDIVVPNHANFPPFATPEDKIESYQHSESSGPDHRPFYNFLEVEDLEGVKDGTNRRGRGEGSAGIDLNLKL